MRHIVAILSILLVLVCSVPKPDIPTNTGCMGNTQAAPCNVVYFEQNAVEWTTQKGD